MSILDEKALIPNKMELDKMERVFHPVGQGAFCSERFFVSDIKINIVYDCGTAYLSRQREGVVRQSFMKDDVIDILFISHLDWDHISLIPTLLNSVSMIRHVVLPHVDTVPILLSLINDSKATKKLRDDVFKIMSSPEEYFGVETKVWQVFEFDEEMEVGKEVILDKLNQKERKIQSGNKIFLSDKMFWCYIPYNYHEKTGFIELLEEELRKKSCLWKGLSSILNNDIVTIESAIEALKKTEVVSEVIKTKCLRNKLKGIYDKLEGKVNGNSLVVYSGPNNSKSNSTLSYLISCTQGVPFKPIHEYYAYFLTGMHCFDINNRPACLYNGDSTYNESALMKKFRSQWNNIGTIQVAHHGSKYSHDFKCIEDKFFFCPISYGEKNYYGHPSSVVLSDLLSKNKLPIHITERNGSEFIQLIIYLF